MSRSQRSSTPQNGAPKGPSQRQLRAGELIRHALSELFARDEIEEVGGAQITVTEVRMSPDLRHATAFIMPLAGEAQGVALALLEKHRKFIRGEIGRRIELKFTPDFAFRLDPSFDAADQITQLLRQPDVARDLGEPPVESSEN